MFYKHCALWFCLWLATGHSSYASEMESAPQPMVTVIPAPAAGKSGQPNLFTDQDGRVYLSWIERGEAGKSTLYFSVLKHGAWSSPQVIFTGTGQMVNPVDFPSLVRLQDGALAAHWLKNHSGGGYDIQVSFSSDLGKNWSDPITPHTDNSPTEHGFVSLLPATNGDLDLVWLDGRDYAEETRENQTALRYAQFDKSGQKTSEVVLDQRVCDCCQTAAANTRSGKVVVYRDRSANEIRDIAIVRYRDGEWMSPKVIHADGWEFHGCPVNGPSVDAKDRDLVISWYTGAGSTPQINLLFSRDEGDTFGRPVRVDGGDPLGRVGVVLLDNRSALVSWIEAGELRVRRVFSNGQADSPVTLAKLSSAMQSGVPQLVRNTSGVYFAVTQRGKPSSLLTGMINYKVKP
ncbi:hypothetical protein QP938_13480 [Porticoccaceae bacterium LTM1]|nr:hypothetical protein QP938_13480 [Porticoccaceae bacterium LTM1]